LGAKADPYLLETVYVVDHTGYRGSGPLIDMRAEYALNDVEAIAQVRSKLSAVQAP